MVILPIDRLRNLCYTGIKGRQQGRTGEQMKGTNDERKISYPNQC